MKNEPQKTVSGTVTSLSGQNTVKVTIQGSVVHPKYHKRYSVTRSLLVDTKGQTVSLGDNVIIHEIKPVSKHKAWAVQSVMKTEK